MKSRFAVPSRASSPTTRSTSVCFLTSRVSRIHLPVWTGTTGFWNCWLISV
jgi:hypothetical protein